MVSCPYPTHERRIEVIREQLPIGFCRQGCGRTFFFCPDCMEANRPPAQFCRQCGASLSFERAEAQQGNDRLPRGERSHSYKLNEYGITEVLALKSHKGCLIVVGDRGVILFDIHKLHEPLVRFDAPSGRAVRGVTFVNTPDDEQLLVTTSRGVYRISLITMQADSQPVWELKATDRYIAHPVVTSGGQLYILELDEKGRSSRLLRLPNDEVVRFDGTSRPPLRLNENKFFFFTESKVFLHDSITGETKQTPFPERLVETEAAYSEKVEAFYLIGESALWRLSLLGGELNPVNLPTRILSGPHLSARDDRVYVAHSQGFTILDPLGNVRWDSKDLFIHAASDGLAPQLTNDYVLFTALGQNGGTDLRVHELGNLKAFQTFTYSDRFLCPPLLVHGRLLVATGGARNLELNCTT
jgi:hypothetical protein